MLPYAARKGWGVFMLGASAESNAGACARLRQTYPDLRIVGHQDGYFTDSAQVVEQINASGADLVFVAMGSPTQEYWIAKHRELIDAPFCMGVGGSFDVVSGRIRRAPGIFRRTGTEWLFQLLTEPHKRFKRQTVYVPFMLRVVSKKLLGSIGQPVDDAARPAVSSPGCPAKGKKSPVGVYSDRPERRRDSLPLLRGVFPDDHATGTGSVRTL